MSKKTLWIVEGTLLTVMCALLGGLVAFGPCSDLEKPISLRPWAMVFILLVLACLVYTFYCWFRLGLSLTLLAALRPESICDVPKDVRLLRWLLKGTGSFVVALIIVWLVIVLGTFGQ